MEGFPVSPFIRNILPREGCWQESGAGTIAPPFPTRRRTPVPSAASPHRLLAPPASGGQNFSYLPLPEAPSANIAGCVHLRTAVPLHGAFLACDARGLACSVTVRGADASTPRSLAMPEEPPGGRGASLHRLNAVQVANTLRVIGQSWPSRS